MNFWLIGSVLVEKKITIRCEDKEKEIVLPMYGEITLEIRNGEIIYIVNNEREKWQK